MATAVSQYPAARALRQDRFPPLPLGRVLWSDAAANIVHLDLLLSRLPDSMIEVRDVGLRAVALIVGGSISDAVWVDDRRMVCGEAAAAIILEGGRGHVSGYAVDDPRVALCLPLLWRGTPVIDAVAVADAGVSALLEHVEVSGANAVMLVEGATTGAALFADGALVGVYSHTRPRPVASSTALRALLEPRDALLTLLTAPGGPSLAEAPSPAAALAAPSPAAARATPTLTGAASILFASEMGYSGLPSLPAPDPHPMPNRAPVVPPAPLPPAAAPREREVDEELPGAASPAAGLRDELVGIAIAWLGDADAAAVLDILDRSAMDIDEVIPTIARIGGSDLAGRDRALVRAMAREMHFRAVEWLCGT